MLKNITSFTNNIVCVINGNHVSFYCKTYWSMRPGLTVIKLWSMSLTLITRKTSNQNVISNKYSILIG